MQYLADDSLENIRITIPDVFYYEGNFRCKSESAQVYMGDSK